MSSGPWKRNTVPGEAIDRAVKQLEEAKGGANPSADVYLGEDPAESEEREFRAGLAAERQEEAMSKREKDLVDENARLKEANLKYERLHKKWVLGDYSDLAVDHPFEIVIHTSDNPWSDFEVTPEVNGKKYPIVRGIPTRVPHFVVMDLENAKVDALITYVGPNGFPMQRHELVYRFPFAAHPIY